MNKVMINAESLRRLLEHQPEAMAELTKNATSLVADQIKAKITTEGIADAISHRIKEAFAYPHLWTGKTLLSQEIRKLVKEETKTAINEELAKIAVAEVMGTVVHQMIRDLVKEKFDAGFKAEVRAAVKEMLK